MTEPDYPLLWQQEGHADADRGLPPMWTAADATRLTELSKEAGPVLSSSLQRAALIADNYSKGYTANV